MIKVDAQSAGRSSKRTNLVGQNGETKNSFLESKTQLREDDGIFDDDQNYLHNRFPQEKVAGATLHQKRVDGMLSNIFDQKKQDLFGGFVRDKPNYHHHELANDFRIDDKGFEINPRKS